MASYTIPTTDGAHTVENQVRNELTFHTFGFKGATEITAGKLTVQTSVPGSTLLIDVGTYDFSAPKPLTYVGPASKWVVTPASVEGSDLLHMTVTSIATGK